MHRHLGVEVRVVIYARFSSANQRDTSIDDQVRKCMQAVEEAGWTVGAEMILTDYQVSGASTARAAFDRLYSLVRQEPPGVDVVVTESADRISRDLGDADRFFKQLQFAGVRLICVSDGIDSQNQGSRLVFNMKAMMADWFLEDLRAKTLRGLEGQALRGWSTGGLPTGYRSEPVGDPKKPDGFRILIDEEAARVVVMIFERYREGLSLRSIAQSLHEQGVPPPRVNSRRRRKGWVAGTIRAILGNEAYVGRWSFGKRRWQKVPGTNQRRYKARPDGEVLRFDRPELRIVPQELWDAVQARRSAVASKYAKGAAKKGGGVAGRRTNYPFSGLLRCGVCGGPMVIIGGSSARYYRCGDQHKRGTCSNDLAVREDVVRGHLLAELERVLLSNKGVVYARQVLAKKLGEASRSIDREKRRIEQQLDRLDRQTRKLIDFISDADARALVPVKEALAEHQAERERLIEELRSLDARGRQPIKLPTFDEVQRVVFDLNAVLASDPTRAREALRPLFKDGSIVLEPQEDGSYLARTSVLPLMVLPAASSKKPRSGGAGGASGSGVYFGGCAGRI